MLYFYFTLCRLATVIPLRCNTLSTALGCFQQCVALFTPGNCLPDRLTLMDGTDHVQPCFAGSECGI